MYHQRKLVMLLASTFVVLLSFGGRSSNNPISIGTATKPSLEVITASNADRLAPLTIIKHQPLTSLFSPIWSPDGRFLAVIETPPEGATEKLESFIFLFDTANFTTPVRQFNEQLTEFIEFSPDSKLLLSLDVNEGLTVYDVFSSKKKYNLKGRGLQDFETQFSPDSKLLAVYSRDGKIRLLDANTGTEKLLLPGYQMSPAFSADGSTLATIEDGNEKNPTQSVIWLWDVKSGKGTAFRKTSAKRAIRLTYSPNNDVLAIEDFDSSIELVNIKTGQQQFFFQPHYPYSSGSTALTFSENKTLLAAFGAGEGYLWDYASGKELTVFKNANPDSIHGAVFNHDNSLLVHWIGEAGGLGIWDIANRRDLLVFQRIGDLAFSPDGTMLAISSAGVSASGLCANH